MDTREIQWAELLTDAVNTPGRISAAYTRFHNYSVGNQLLALCQCEARSIALGPIATFPRWKELGRYVRKGEKAITLCMPVTCKRTATEKRDDGTETETESTFTRFVYRPHWFVLAQTDGAEYTPEPIPVWSESQALRDSPVLAASRLTRLPRYRTKRRFTRWHTSFSATQQSPRYRIQKRCRAAFAKSKRNALH